MERGEGYLCFPGGGLFSIILLRKFQKFEFSRGEGSGVPTPVLDLHIYTDTCLLHVHLYISLLYTVNNVTALNFVHVNISLFL